MAPPSARGFLAAFLGNGGGVHELSVGIESEELAYRPILRRVVGQPDQTPSVCVAISQAVGDPINLDV